ncbi:recombinase family protein [Lentzea tibetensis]|uniref:recombinase family protein n=1 Tax=Lentzea tibetensis TaxID=2591470 RepID=UPI001F1AF709|nr:recombinase family protein [Lentzea tibetensis]
MHGDLVVRTSAVVTGTCGRGARTGDGASRCAWPTRHVPPSRRPERRNRHRLGDGWQGSTVRAILENPRYTGYAFFGRWTKHETLFDPGNVAAMKRLVPRLRRKPRDK